jgi:hypothetical protein
MRSAAARRMTTVTAGWRAALAALRVAGGRLGEGQFVGGGLEVIAEEAGVVAVARGIDADAKADSGGGTRSGKRRRRIEGSGCEHGNSPKRKKEGTRTRESFASVGP